MIVVQVCICLKGHWVGNTRARAAQSFQVLTKIVGDKRERSLSLSGFLCFQTIGLGYFSHPLSVSLWRDDPSMPVFRGFRLPVVSVFP